MEIFITGPVGFDAAEKLYHEHKQAIDSHFPKFFIEEFEKIGKSCPGLPETESSEEIFIKEIKTGGLFGCLWEMGKELKTGLVVDLKKVPVRQEIIEIMELYGENPYECPSPGSHIAFAKDEEAFQSMETLKFTSIGYTTSSKARIVKTVEGERFLTPPSRQEKDITDRRLHTQKTNNMEIL